MKKGRMIVVDGSNGAGKTTVIEAIRDHLQHVNRETVFTREPGGTPIGEKIREILLSPEAGEMADVTELMLFAAARAQHVREKIMPAVEAGKVVVSDRFDSATVSFQHYARGLPLELITTLNEIAVDGLKPDMTIILDLDPEAGLVRVGSRGDDLDRLEKEKLDFLHKARDGYLGQAKASPDNFVVIDASQSLDNVISEVLSVVDQVIEA
ncbi:dTMP kinase [Congregibacter litoralis]|uniref:Thymidylate kinase n=1 Tax=Congregibacter litoralis KT71 TaxID=314285 RepID=A4A8F5_9GAMM|nr:dTMP kinase [Congregibacter litoralis]EAQ97950.1 thymidylate kinase [Congregibacter litoralis KT71]